jgi:hypothetical protein
MVKKRSANGGCLGSKRRRRTWYSAISLNEEKIAVIVKDFRMGEPVYRDIDTVKRIHILTELTWGTETSKYPKEKKSIEIPEVAASEQGEAKCDIRIERDRKCWKARTKRVIFPYIESRQELSTR